MAKKKISLENNLKEYKLPTGTKFFAKDEKDALLYSKKVGDGIGTDGKYFHSKGDEY